MKKLYAVIIGLAAGLISVHLLGQLFKGLIAYLALGNDVTIRFTGIRLAVDFSIGGISNFFLFAVIIVSPFILSMLFIELSLIWLNRVTNDHVRSSIIIFQLINIGYLIFTAIIGILSIILQTAFPTDWSMLLNSSNLSYNQKLIFMFLVLFILLGYINILTKRIRKSIPVFSKK